MNDRVKCLLRAYDGNRYSASGLVMRIWELSEYENAPVSVQGPGRWMLDENTSLWDLTVRVLAEQDEQG